MLTDRINKNLRRKNTFILDDVDSIKFDGLTMNEIQRDIIIPFDSWKYIVKYDSFKIAYYLFQWMPHNYLMEWLTDWSLLEKILFYGNKYRFMFSILSIIYYNNINVYTDEQLGIILNYYSLINRPSIREYLHLITNVVPIINDSLPINIGDGYRPEIMVEEEVSILITLSKLLFVLFVIFLVFYFLRTIF